MRIFYFIKHEFILIPLLNILFLCVFNHTLQAEETDPLPVSHTSIAAYHRSLPRINNLLSLKQLSFGSPVFIRIFKLENELELWLQGEYGFKLYKTYIVCFKSGQIGPKLKEGDRQSPEGFYHVSNDQMNPWSDFHLAFNLGYPNDYDRFYNRSGSALMIHGRCSSDGCFAMTDYYMDEIYTLVNEALENNQVHFQVHIFPFRLTDRNMQEYRHSRWYSFWLNLKEGYDFFEFHRIPPVISVSNGRYIISEPHKGDQLAREMVHSGQIKESTL